MTRKLFLMAIIGLLASPIPGAAALVTVWDTLDGAQMGGGGMTIGNFSSSTRNIRQGILFRPSATGYFANFTFGGSQSEGTSDWLFTLRADGGGMPGAILETLPLVDVNRTATVAYEVAAGGLTLLSEGVPYWLMAELPNGSAGAWAIIGSGSAPGTRAACDLKVGCQNYTVYNDSNIGAARIQVNAVPAPATMTLVVAGLVGVVVSRRRGVLLTNRAIACSY